MAPCPMARLLWPKPLFTMRLARTHVEIKFLLQGHIGCGTVILARIHNQKNLVPTIQDGSCDVLQPPGNRNLKRFQKDQIRKPKSEVLPLAVKTWQEPNLWQEPQRFAPRNPARPTFSQPGGGSARSSSRPSITGGLPILGPCCNA